MTAVDKVSSRAIGGWRITLDAPTEGFGLFDMALSDFAQSVAIVDVGRRGIWHYEAFSTEEPDRGALEAALALAAASIDIDPPVPEIVELPPTDWLAENRSRFPPLRIGRFFLHRSGKKASPPAGAIRLALDASLAFGTGEHGTTRGCLKALEHLAKAHRPARVLDMGCGTAVLGMAAARLWPTEVLAVDNDPMAIMIAEENLAQNGLRSRVEARIGDGYRALRHSETFNLVVSNILARPLMAMAPQLARALGPGGRAILSGLLADQQAMVLSAHLRQGLALERRLIVDGWATLILVKRHAKRG